MGLANGETLREFWRLYDLPPTDDCILWPHGRTKQGYGKLTVNGRVKLAHAFALEVRIGPRPSPNHDAAHSCRNRHCINPAHLRWATRSDNSLDRHRDGTVTQAKLTANEVLAIRRLARDRSMTQREIAEQFGVSLSNIEYIVARKTWRHLPEEAA